LVETAVDRHHRIGRDGRRLDERRGRPGPGRSAGLHLTEGGRRAGDQRGGQDDGRGDGVHTTPLLTSRDLNPLAGYAERTRRTPRCCTRDSKWSFLLLDGTRGPRVGGLVERGQPQGVARRT